MNNTLRISLKTLLIYSLTLFFHVSADAQQNSVRVQGTVADPSGIPLIGVNVVVEGTSNGTVTDMDGKYVLTVPSGNSALTFTYIGYTPLSISVNNRILINVTMTEDNALLDEVVVIGYGTQRKKDLTGAVGVVETEKMDKLISPNINQALQGMVSGVTVASSGAPGSVAEVRVRGFGSFSGVGPLYVVDGMILEGSQREFNVNDIESMQILKDASAAAIYGARGANGVVIITTKKGKSEVPKISFSANYGIDNIAKRYKTMNSLEFLRVNRQAYENANKIWPGEPEQGQVLQNTDWQEEFFKTGNTQDYNINISGNSKYNSYYVGVNEFLQDGTVKGPTYERTGLRINTEIKKGIIRVGENFMIARSHTKLMVGNPFIDLARMPPIIPVYDSTQPDGYGLGSTAYQTYGTNPIGLQETHDYNQRSYRIIGDAFAEIEIIKNLKFKSGLGIEYHNYFDKYITINKMIRYLSTSSKYENGLSERRGDFFKWLWDNTLFYSNKIGQHKFDVLAGYSANKYTFQNTNASMSNFLAGYPFLGATGQEPSVGSGKSLYTMASFLGRINYDFADRYLLQLNYRNDGSSRFGDKRRHGNFTSISFGWRVSEEPFFKLMKNTVNDLKLRASYGSLGDQQTLSPWQYTTFLFTGEGIITGADQKYTDGAIQKGRANPYLHWESKRTLNLGVDFSLFNQSLYGTAEYFNSISDGLLMVEELPWSSGTDLYPFNNVGSLRNRGFEVNLGYRKTNGDFRFDVSLNLSSIKTKALDLGDVSKDADYHKTILGGSLGDFYLIETNGIFQNWDEVYDYTADIIDEETGESQTVQIQPTANPGDIRYVDFNKDGMINLDDRQYAGTPIPKFESGLNGMFYYKNFDFNVFLMGVFGNKIFNATRFWMERMDETANYTKGLTPWTPENHSTTTPRAFYGPNQNTLVYTDRWIEDGSYVRVKNLQLGYSFPKTWINETLSIEALRLSAGVQNLFTFTKYSGLDPEISGGGVFSRGTDNGHYPPLRTITFGIKCTF